MKKLIVLALYLVTWKTYSAVMLPVETAVPGNQGAVKNECKLEVELHQREYFNWFHAATKASELKMDAQNFDVRVWELEEPQMKERK